MRSKKVMMRFYIKKRTTQLIATIGLVFLTSGCSKLVDKYLPKEEGTSSVNPTFQAPYYAPQMITPPRSADIGESLYNKPSSWDARYHYLWGFETVGAPGIWDELPAEIQEVVVAVIDTGVDVSHAELTGRIWTNTAEIPGNAIDDDGNGFIDDVNGYNWVAGSGDIADDNGHGTHVSGTIAATVNASGIIGVSPFVKIMPLKVLDNTGAGSFSDVLDAINYAILMGAHVVNLSLGVHRQDLIDQFGATDGETFFWELTADANTRISNAVTGVHGRKVAVFVAAGNEATPGAPSYDPDLTPLARNSIPANARYAITIAAHDPNSARCNFSNYGWKLDFSLPGCGLNSSGILSTRSSTCSSSCGTNFTGDTTLSRLNGTSMASPHAVGLAALAFSTNTALTPLKMRQALRLSINSLSGGTSVVDQEFGFGNLVPEQLSSLSEDVSGALIGVKISSPYDGSAPSVSTGISFSIEAPSESYEWRLYDVSGATLPSNFDFSTLSGPVAQGAGVGDQNLNSTLSLNSSQPHLIILEVQGVSGGPKFYDTLELVP